MKKTNTLTLKKTSQNKNIYLDYLDYNLNSSNANVRKRLLFDILIFHDYNLFISVPACIKLESTAKILMELSELWKKSRIKLVLDAKYNKKPMEYIYNRKKILESSFSDENLSTHFEYVAYNADYTNFFYNKYLNGIISENNHENLSDNIFVNRSYSADTLFRDETKKIALNYRDERIKFIKKSFRQTMDKSLTKLIDIANKKGELFQRTSIVNELFIENTTYNSRFSIYINKIINDAFCVANASACDALPVSYITDKVTSINFTLFLKYFNIRLHNLLCSLTFDEALLLSEHTAWKTFMDRINILFKIYKYDAYNNNYKVLLSILMRSNLSKVAKGMITYYIGVSLEGFYSLLFHISSYFNSSKIDRLSDFTFSSVSFPHKIRIEAIEKLNIISKELEIIIAEIKNDKPLDNTLIHEISIRY